jgi:protein-serine/threonine kinase
VPRQTFLRLLIRLTWSVNMAPSPSTTAAGDTIAAARITTGAPEPILPTGMIPDSDPEQFEFDHNILLSPPTSTAGTDPFDDAASNPPGRDSLDVDSINRRNIAAHVLNAQHTLHQLQAEQSPPRSEPIATGLEIKTDLPTNLSSLFSGSVDSDSHLRHSYSNASIPKRTPSIRAALHSTAGSLSPGSALSSPQLAAMLNITPLPSPIEPSRDPWKLNLRTRSRGSSLVNAEVPPEPSKSTLSPPSSPPKRKAYNGLRSPSRESHTKLFEVTSDNISSDRDRSVSDYVPDAITLAKPRNVAVSGNVLNQESIPAQSAMHREQYLAVQRGFTVLLHPLKTPSTSISTQASIDTDTSGEPEFKKPKIEYYVAQSVATGHPRKYKLLRLLGQGTFSKVFLAVRQVDNEDDGIDYARASTNLDGVRIRSRRLVAVKVVEQGPAGGADAERVEISLRREVEVLKSINHPSLVHLKAFGAEATRSLLVLNYCPGGDLFEVASTQLDVLVPSLVRRIFAELVSAVRYLHQKFIVHRDIKLESKSVCLRAVNMLNLT